HLVQADDRRFVRPTLAQMLKRALAADDEVIEEDRFLRGEVLEDRSPPDVGGLGDLVDRGLGEPLRLEQLQRRLGDARPLRGRVALSRADLGHAAGAYR